MRYKYAFYIGLAIVSAVLNSLIQAQPDNDGDNDGTQHDFLMDSYRGPRVTPITLGRFPHQCVGNIHACPSTGFTMSLWTTPRARPPTQRLRYTYLLSSGGQSISSEGYYVRRLDNKEYEVGVGVGDHQWVVRVHLTDGNRSNLAFTWSSTLGLKIYVDGLEAAQDPTGRTRIFTEPAVDPFTEIVVGKANDDVLEGGSYPDLEIGRIRHWEGVKTQQEISTFIDPDGSAYLLGCVDQFPGQGAPSSDPARAASPATCRAHCATQHKHIAVLITGSSCDCLDQAPSGLSTQCSNPSVFHIHIATNLRVSVDYPINLEAEQIPTKKGYILPNEPVVFETSTQAEEEVTFYIDFRDGHSHVTKDQKFSHSFAAPATYSVNITASTRLSSETKFLEVKVEAIDEGKPPAELFLKTDSSDTQSRTVLTYFTALGYQTKTCSLSFGDGTTERYEEAEMIFNNQEGHTYDTIGFYGVVAECENAYGKLVEEETIMVVQPTFEYEYNVRNLDIAIPVIGADVTTNDLLVLVNEQETQMTKTGRDILLNQAVFSYSGEHLVQLKGKDGQTMLTKVFNLQTPITEVDISASIIHTEVDEEIELEFRIGKGDQMHVWISYGDGEEEFLYIPRLDESEPVTIRRNKTFSKLGLYSVDIIVANEISSKNFTQVISVERPMEMAQLLSHNVTELGTPTVFSFDVDRHMIPQAPVDVFIDFQDGIAERYTLGTWQASPKLLNISHTYNTFGIYRVKAEVSNNLSMIAVSVLVQVGENITYIDIFTNKERVVKDEEVEITVHCPRGNPIHLEVDFGDGTQQIIDRPEVIDQYLNGIIPDPTTTTTRPTTTTTVGTQEMPIIEEVVEESSGEEPDVNVETLEGGEPTVRKRRAAVVEDEEGSGEVMDANKAPIKAAPPPTPAPRQSFILKHRYTTPGTFIVKAAVKNKFGKADAYLCPAITVVKESAKSVSCSKLTANILNTTSEQSPMVMMRSKVIAFAGESSHTCKDTLGRTLSVRHTWSAQKLSPYKEWRPELAVCQFELQAPQMVLPPNRMWYGLYRINYKVSMRIHPTRARRSTNETENALLAAQERLAAEALEKDNTDYTILLKEHFDPLITLDDTEGTLVASTAAVGYLQVIPTPLVAKVRGVEDGAFREVTWWEYISIDLDPSYDPDIPVGGKNKSGMNFDIVCYQRKYKDQVKELNLKQLLAKSTKIANNTVNTARLWEFNMVFEQVDKYLVVYGYEAVFSGKHITMNDTVWCTSFVSKDERVSSLTTKYQSTDSNFTDVGAALNMIDDLLASGDTSAALMVIDMATDALNNVGGDNETDAKTARSNMRGKLIGALGSCADSVKNLDQLEKTAGGLNKITEVSDEVSEDGKETAAGALGSAAGKAGSLAEDAPVSQVTGMAGNMMGAAGNVLPFDEEDEEPEYELDMEGNPILPEGVTIGYDDQGNRVITTTTAAPGAGGETEDLSNHPSLQHAGGPSTPEEEEEEEPDIPCCEREAGLCEWIEPSCQAIDEDDRKGDLWDEFICDEIHPDDMKIFRERFEQSKRAAKLTKFEKKKKTTQGGWGACNKMGDVVQGKQGDSSEEINIDTPKIKMKLAKIDPNANSTLGAFKVPAGLGAAGGGAAILESPNPFTYSDSSSEVKSKVISMTMKNPDGSPMEVSDSAEPIEMWIPGKPSLVPPARKFSFLTSANSEKVKMNYHSITVNTNNTGMHIMIRPMSPDDSYLVYLKYLEFPNETYFDWVAEVPNKDSFDTEDPWKLEQLRYTVFPPTNLTALNGTYKVGIQLAETKMTLANMDQENNFTYSFRTFTSGCRFWNDSTDMWESGGCDVGPLTTIKETQCLCTHLTSFGGDFVVPPNTIDFSTVFSAEKFLESMPVFCTVIIILAIYVAAIIWCRIQDKKDLIKWGATPLEDNLPTDTYHYQVTVNTGLKKNSNTDSRIQLILSGDEGDTGVRRLFDGKRKEMPVGSIYNYILSVEHSLGPLTYMRIWHDNSGKGKKKSWFLDQIMVTDIQTGEKFVFLCNRWLAVEEDDGMVERVLPVAGFADLTAFNHLFGASVRKKLTNDHLWFSVVSRPTKSSFTRVQRVSCCVSLLFLTMITNCMFFKADDNVEQVSTLKVGPFTFTLHQLFISVVTTCIVFPPSMFIVTVFRKARPKNNSIMQMNQSLSQKSKKFRWRKFNAGSSLWTNVEQTKMQKFKESMRNIMTFHQKAKYETEGGGQDDTMIKKKKKKGWTLPWWTIYIAWIITFFAIVGSGFFTILYSMEWGHEKSLEWLQTFVLSFFQSVAVVQPIKVLLLAAFISCVLRKPDLDEEEESFDEVNAGGASNADLTNSQRDLQEIIKARKIKATDIPPVDTEALEKARQTRMNEMQMEAILKEFIVFFIFILVLFFLSYQTRDADSFMFAENIKNTFVRTSPSFDSVSAPQKFWQYTFRSLLPNLYTDKWYNGKDINWREALQIDDRQTIRVGVARFRQLRIKEDTCKIQPGFETIINHCRSDYNWRDDDTKDYLPGWKLPDPEKNDSALVSHSEKYCELIGEKNAALNGKRNSPWIYRSSVELKNGPYAGTIGMYKGGGYTFTFRRSRKKTERLLQILENMEWVDTKTRGVFLEFTLYNANVNLFGSVIMLVEWMAAGSAITRAEVKVFRLSSYVGGFGIVVVFFEVCYLCFTLYFIKRLYTMLKKEKLKYFKDFWNMLEFATLVMSLVAIVMYAMKKIFGNFAMNALAESGSGEYVNFVTISIWDEIFGFILACVVFTSTIKFIKMLKFNKRMSMLGDTVQVAMKDIKNFMVVFCIFFLAFALTAYALFGKELPSYGTFIGTLEALFAFALGDFDFDAFKQAHGFLGPMFFFVYVLVVYIGLMGMFLTIIYDAFAEVKANAEMRSNDYEIVDFMMKKFKGVFGWS